MPHVPAADGVRLYYEEAGRGTPVLWVHEFAGDHRSFEPQLRHFARRYRCVAFNARGYPPSDVPEPDAYSQEHAWRDIVAVMDGLGIDRAHVVGVSMGAFATLHLGLEAPARTRSLVLGGCGYGADPDGRARFEADSRANADRFEAEGMARGGAEYAMGPTRVTFRDKDRRGWEEFARQFAEHSAAGSARTMRGVQARRPSLYALEERLRTLPVPVLVITGDEDTPCLQPALMLKRTIPGAALSILPRTGHALNLEEPAAFNAAVEAFWREVET